MRLSVVRIALMYEGKIQQCDTPANVKASLGVQRLEVYLPVMQLDQAESILKHNADLREVVSDVQRFGDRLDVLSSSKQVTHEIRRTGAATNSDPRFCHRYPNLENTLARLREIKGDSSGVNYPGFTPKNNRMERRLARKISVKYSVTFAPSIK